MFRCSGVQQPDFGEHVSSVVIEHHHPWQYLGRIPSRHSVGALKKRYTALARNTQRTTALCRRRRAIDIVRYIVCLCDYSVTFSSRQLSTTTNQSEYQPPRQWLHCTVSGGILLIEAAFEAPYFTLHMYEWHCDTLSKHVLRPEMVRTI